ncbi:S8 family serine peptidase [Salipiger sp. P9]|uniref:S8 family peptidase n=1 Tax=Salipiger pentaromativorans TaxID=2943193 RepID=UPI0021576328|nr:S8 family serine peptidase [Salipiger pentaromativorans]MCR8548731.1 S8 family serine peptidase [Salipiger pentaromativorans]
MFVILRDSNASFRNRAPRPSGPFSGPSLGPSAFDSPLASVVPPAPSLETADLSAGDLRDVAHDPSVTAVARAMPTKLIEPEPLDDVRSADAEPAWGIAAVGAEASPFTGAGVRVAVLDTGIDTDHPAFAGVNLITRDFAGSGIEDANGHGTHCAGTVFGRDVDGQRIGVARGVTEALIGKVLADDGRGSSDMLFQAMKWASDQQAQVISMSLGFDFPGFAERLQEQDWPPLLATSAALEGYRMNLRMFDALMDMLRAQAAFTGGTVVCAAAGNESRRTVSPQFEVSASVPAAAVGVVSVGALGQGAAGLGIAPFSNTNPTLSAPGVNVISAGVGGGLRALNGTSMACPHVAGIAALWWEAQRASGNPASAEAVRARLLATCTSAGIDPATDALDRGQGLVQAPAPALVG